ncbi:HdeD family acid-resistance protein [Actinoplanes sp. RD1]|uniref:HdeD family acid-resistance protein n=1 Tax=Actinoplanes sp. RD1 TaxID=3064538 RepID=UPI002741A212|nr:DUF308 domain-containing protein [Actinoplanes sp. RD1]
MFKSLSASLLWRGILALVVGVVSLAWPGITVGAFVFMFAVYALLIAGIDAGRAFSSDKAGPVVGNLILALLAVATAVVAIAWPGITALVLTLTVAVWAFASGVVEVVFAFRRGATAGERAMWAVSGLISLALGVSLAVRPDIGAVSLATVFGIFSVAYGIALFSQSARARKAGKLITA